MMLGGWPAWRGRLGILWWVADLDRRLVRSGAPQPFSDCQRQDGFHRLKLLLEQNDVSLISKQGKIFPGKI